MSAYNLDMTPEDIGEIIEIIRIQHLKMNDDVFCEKLGIKPSLLFTVEQGKGPHGMMVLKKIHNTFKHVNIGITVEFR
jgi:hypothetical protein